MIARPHRVVAASPSQVDETAHGSRPSSSTAVIRVGIVGCGHWGPNHVRNFSSMPNVSVEAVADLNPDSLKELRHTYPNIRTTKDYEEILKSPDIDAISVVTPTSTHYEITKTALESGKHVLCEKPLGFSSEECEKLVETADRRKLILMVGHVFVFNPGIQRFKELLEEGRLGQVYYAHATRTNLGPIRQDVNVAWDLASHDISIFNYLFNSTPIEVSATGTRVLPHDVQDVVFMSCFYPEGRLANIHVSWMDPKKVREITVVGDKTMVVWNDLVPEGPIRIYDKGILQDRPDNFGEFKLLVRDGDISIPKIPSKEPLRVEIEHFVECIRTGSHPQSDAGSALDVVRTLEAVDDSLRQRGRTVPVRQRSTNVEEAIQSSSNPAFESIISTT